MKGFAGCRSVWRAPSRNTCGSVWWARRAPGSGILPLQVTIFFIQRVRLIILFFLYHLKRYFLFCLNILKKTIIISRCKGPSIAANWSSSSRSCTWSWESCCQIMTGSGIVAASYQPVCSWVPLLSHQPRHSTNMETRHCTGPLQGLTTGPSQGHTTGPSQDHTTWPS